MSFLYSISFTKIMSRTSQKENEKKCHLKVKKKYCCLPKYVDIMDIYLAQSVLANNTKRKSCFLQLELPVGNSFLKHLNICLNHFLRSFGFFKTLKICLNSFEHEPFWESYWRFVGYTEMIGILIRFKAKLLKCSHPRRNWMSKFEKGRRDSYQWEFEQPAAPQGWEGEVMWVGRLCT